MKCVECGHLQAIFDCKKTCTQRSVHLRFGVCRRTIDRTISSPQFGTERLGWQISPTWIAETVQVPAALVRATHALFHSFAMGSVLMKTNQKHWPKAEKNRLFRGVYRFHL